MIEWSFSKLDRLSKNRDPMNEAFFDDSDTLTDVNSLVRESIQNSIDERIDETIPVRVRFSLQNFDPTSKTHSKYFQGLMPHVSKVLGDATANKLNESSARALVIEDFNTAGLTGSTKNDIPNEDQKKNSNFFYFVHAEGSTNKSEGKKGKWGVGKVVYPKVSEIRAFFIFSNRTNGTNNNPVALGQCILKTHKIGTNGYQPDGWFASFAPEEGYFELPEQDASNLESDWALTRSTGTGLSLVIPFLQNEIDADTLLSAVVREYFMAIILGDLVCEISDEDQIVRSVDSISIKDCVQMVSFKKDKDRTDFERVLELALALQLGVPDTFTAELCSFEGAIPELTISEEDRTKMVQNFNSGTIQQLIVPVSVPLPDTGSFATSQFSFIFKAHEEGDQTVTFSREGILVPGRRVEISRDSTVLVHVGSGHLANLLGLAEGPAHTNWDAKNRKFKDAFQPVSTASRVITFVRGKPNSLVRSLTSIDDKFEESILAKFFENPKIGSGESKSTKPKLDLPRTDTKLAVSGVPGGFRIASSGAKIKANERFRVLLAYGVAKGNAFSKWDANDFDIGAMQFSSKNLALISRTGNVLEFSADSSDFNLSVVGFDPLRNIEFDVRTVEGPVAKGGDY